MSKRAEEAALKAYPPIATVPKLQDVGTGELYDPHTHERLVYIQGYQQAEKDYIELAQLWVDSGNVNIMSFKRFLKTKLEEE